MKAYHSVQLLLLQTAQVVGASTTAAVSEVFTPSYLDAKNGVLDVKVSAITNSSSASVITLQDSADGVAYATVKSSAAFSTTGFKSIRWNVQNSTDQGYLPLRPFCRIVVTTGAGDSVTVSDVRISNAG